MVLLSNHTGILPPVPSPSIPPEVPPEVPPPPE